MSLQGSFATDPDLETNGITITYPDPERGELQAYRVKLRRFGGKNADLVTRVRDRLMKPYRTVNWEDIPQKIRDEINIRNFVEASIVSFETKMYEGANTKLNPDADGWLRGIELQADDGSIEIVTSSVENICKALSQVPDFRDMLVAETRNQELYKVQRREAAAKN